MAPIKRKNGGRVAAKAVYLDHAAATPLDARVLKAMQSYYAGDFTNPSALYDSSVKARKAVEDARARIASKLNCKPQELIFTPGGTASDNLAVLGVVRAYFKKGLFANLRKLANKEAVRPGLAQAGHVIVSSIEHEAVLRPARQLEKEGLSVTRLPVDSSGIVDVAELKKALRPDTILVSIMYANNEIGTIQPIREIAKAIREFKKVSRLHPCEPPFFHADACQAANYLDLNVQKLGVDLFTFNASKIYGPKGIGALYVKSGIVIEPLVYGGGQERGLWSGTENVPAIAGFARAVEIACEMRKKESRRLEVLRDYFISKLQKTVSGVSLNGHATMRLPNNIHISIDEIEGEVMVAYLDARGICAAVGSACTSHNIEPSHVLKAIGLSDKKARSSIRMTLGRSTSKNDCNYVVEAVKSIATLLRK
jgi:cysteine desulfurase